MQIAQVLAGYTLGGADLLRRAMGKKKPEEMAAQRDGFVSGAIEQGVDRDQAAHIFDLVEKFAGYGFNKSHSAAYALLSYQTAWLKAHHPAAFMSAVMSADMDHTDKVVVMIDECQRMGIEVAPPDVNASDSDFGVVDDTVIRYGLGAIKGLGQAAIESIVAERKAGGTYASLYDFCLRVDMARVNRRALEALINAGAMDALGANRASLMQGLTRAHSAAQQARDADDAGQADMFGLGDAGAEDDSGPALTVVAEWPEDERLRAERDTLGLYLTGHPIKRWEDELALFTHGKIAALVAAMPRPEECAQARRSDKRAAVVAGFVVDVRRMRKGRRVVVVLDDGSARIECPLFEEKAEQAAHLLVQDKLLVVDGSLSYDDFSDDFRLNANEVMDIAGARQRYANRVLLNVGSDQGLDVDALAGCIDRYREDDGCGIALRYVNDTARAVLTIGDARVRVCDDLLADLRGLVGARAVKVRYRRASSSQS